MPLESAAIPDHAGMSEVGTRPTLMVSNLPTRQSFLSALAAGVLLLGVSGSLLLLGFLTWPLMTADRSAGQPATWPGNKLLLIQGKGQAVSQGLEVRALSPKGWAIVSSNQTSLNARSYPLLQWSLVGLHPELKAVFLWQTADDNPKRWYAAALPWSGDGPQVLSLAQYGAWQGTITTFEIALYGRLQKPVVVEQLELMPMSVSALLKSLWTEWTAFAGWSDRSINFVSRGPSRAFIQPVPAVAAWVGLALMLYMGWTGLRDSQWDWRVASAVFLIGWMVLDARWQLNLWRQLQETYHRYAGKTWEEKHLAAEDGDLFRFISEVKQRLAGPPQRVFLMIADMGGQERYTFLRAHYYLLPHNVFRLGHDLAGLGHARQGDYVLSLYPAPDQVRFSQSAHVLSWGPNQQLRAEAVFSAPMGSLYKIIGHHTASVPSSLH